jgi:hypothetical protein
MLQVDKQIAEIISARHRALPRIEGLVKQWEKVALDLDAMVAALGSVPEPLAHDPEILDLVRRARSDDLRQGIRSAITDLHAVQTRLARDTVNIGVSGQARVGKSTLLQSISGLGDDQIPTGSGLPVTAVRSRIYHSAKRRQAVLSMHTFESFAADVLRPYHEELAILDIPADGEGFRRFRYPAEDELLESKHATGLGIHKRLLEMQASYPSYEPMLTGGDRSVSLEDLRQFVAYPTADEVKESSGSPARLYLAVRDAAIYTPFPLTRVERLGITDLPGLGELAPGAERHHVAGLRDAVDMVILVKRPEEGMAFWKGEDARALNVLDDARGDVAARDDFAFLLLNISPDSKPALVTSLRTSVTEAVAKAAGGSHYRVLEADASDPDSVAAAVLAPVVEHLANRLGTMDEQVLQGAITRSREVAARVVRLSTDVVAALAAASSVTSSVEEDRTIRTTELREALAADLTLLVNDLFTAARDEAEDAEYAAAIDAVYTGLHEYLRAGLGTGDEEQWVSGALSRMIVGHNAAKVAVDEFNQVRVEIGERYAALNDVLNDVKVRRLWDQVAGVLRAHLGDHLLGSQGTPGDEALRRLSAALDEASELPESVKRAVDLLLELRFDFRTQIYPRVRSELDDVNLEVIDPETGERRVQKTVAITKDGARELYRLIVQRADQAAYRIKKAILLDARLPALVLFAAAEQFEDSFIRAGSSDRDFSRLARSYRDEIWPGVYTNLDADNARISRAAKATQSLRDSANAAVEG